MSNNKYSGKYSKHDLLQDLKISAILVGAIHNMNKNLRKQAYLFTMMVINLIFAYVGFSDSSSTLFIVISSIGLNGGCAIGAGIIIGLIGKSEEKAKKYHHLFNISAQFFLFNAGYWTLVSMFNSNFSNHSYSPGWDYLSDLVTGGYSLIIWTLDKRVPLPFKTILKNNNLLLEFVRLGSVFQ